MARDEVVFRVSADEAKALASFQKLIDKQNQVDNSTKRGTQSVQQQRGALDSWGASLAKGIAAGAGFATMNQALRTGIDLIKQYDDHLGRITDKMDRVGGSAMRAFVGINPGQEGQQFMRQAYVQGARAGLTVEETAQILQPLQSVSATQDEAMARFGYAAQAVQIGVGAQDAMSLERLGVSRGLDPGVASNQLVAAAALSGMGEADFARAAPRTTDFGDWQTGMAAIAALSVSTPEQQLPTTVGAAGRVFGRAADDTDFSERYGLAGMTEPEKIIELWRQAAEDYDPASGVQWDQHLRDFTLEFGEHLGSNEERLAAQQMVQQGLLFASAYQASRTAGADLLPGRVDAMMTDDPVVRAAQLRRQAQATQDVFQVFGPPSDPAQRRSASMIGTGAAMEREGMGAWVGEGFEPGRTARLLNFLSNPSGSEYAGRQGVGIIQEQLPERLTENERAIRELELIRSELVNMNSNAAQTQPQRPRNVDQE